MAKPKILILDIETFPNLVTSWGLHIPSGYLSPENVVQERTIICASWKWYKEDGVQTSCVSAAKPLNDQPVVLAIRDALLASDAVVAHNGDHFDLPWIQTRNIYYGLKPLPPIVQIDTRKIAKSKFYFNSNKLVYLAEFLGIGHKIKTEFDLWKECLQGDQEALDKMVRYNKRDVFLLEKIYERLRPYVPSRINAQLFVTKLVCPTCQSATVHRRGAQMTAAQTYQRYQCQECGSWFRDKRSTPYRGIVG
jgi:predicted RNA-binding Zn-ribbon protein involved in translation (DUF1610 family)